MILNKEEQEMCEGKYGPGLEKSIKLLIQFGEAFDAERMIPVKSCHILNSEPYDWVLDVTKGMNSVRVPTTTHPLVPPIQWERLKVPEALVKDELIQNKERYELYRSLGINLTSTCVSCFVGEFLKLGDVFCWSGTEGSLFANTVFGARGNREAGPISFLSALTGRTPEIFLHKKENRYGQVLVNMDKNIRWSEFTTAKYGALGYHIGGITKDKNVVINHMPDTDFDCLKHLTSALPVSGSTGMCHIVGVTPEAPTLEEAFGHKTPKETISVSEKNIQETWEELTTAKKNQVDLVLIGCPHCSMAEFRQIASLLNGKKVHDNVSLWIGASQQVSIQAKRMQYADIIEKAGGVLTDTCLTFAYLMGDKTVATNSARTDFFTAKKGGQGMLYGTLEECINAAITGKWRS